MPLHISVAVDMDDVLIDFTEHNVQVANAEFGVELTKGTTWDGSPLKTFDWKAHGYKDWWAWLRDQPGHWADSPIIPGATGGIAALRARGYYVELLTSKPEWSWWEVHRWLAEHPRVKFDRVTIVGKNDSKAAVSDAEVLVDDKLENVQEWAASGRNAVLFDQPWNRRGLQPVGIVRALDWPNVVRHITTLALEDAA